MNSSLSARRQEQADKMEELAGPDGTAILRLMWGYPHEDFDGLSKYLGRFFDDPAARSPLLEAHLTKILSLLSGPAETRLIKKRCKKVDLTYSDDMRLFTTTEIANNYPSSFKLAPRAPRNVYQGPGATQMTGPDFVIAVVTPGKDGSEARVRPYIFIEAKGLKTNISYGGGYCRNVTTTANGVHDSHLEGWGSQPTCGPHGCWVDVEPDSQHDFDNAKWVWLQPAGKKTTKDEPWGHIPRPTHAGLREAFDAEIEAAREKWHFLTWEKVAGWIEKTHVPAGSIPVAYYRDADRNIMARAVSHNDVVRGHEALGRALRAWAKKR